jgi:hypothetical protein
MAVYQNGDWVHKVVQKPQSGTTWVESYHKPSNLTFKSGFHQAVPGNPMSEGELVAAGHAAEAEHNGSDQVQLRQTQHAELAKELSEHLDAFANGTLSPQNGARVLDIHKELTDNGQHHLIDPRLGRYVGLDLGVGPRNPYIRHVSGPVLLENLSDLENGPSKGARARLGTLEPHENPTATTPITSQDLARAKRDDDMRESFQRRQQTRDQKRADAVAAHEEGR